MADCVDYATYKCQQQIGRDNWHFTWKVADLLPIVQAAYEHHIERGAWWELERQQAETEVRGSIELRQQQHTGGTHTEAVLDPTHQKRLAESEQKIAGHLAKSEELKAWLVALNHAHAHSSATGHTATVSVTFADLRFFEVGEHDGEDG